ncbi:MAG: HEPN domain-containing protein [Nitrospinae bacterium]|nr:HEPN domain-containing protein [Nitrospinota bacterium]
MDDDKRITIKRWFIKSEHDIKMAYAALLMADPLTDMACFHAQQCAEKSLKAFLVFHDRQVEKTHDLGKLVDACGKLDGSFLVMLPDLRGMSAYAITERYPDDWREILIDEAQEAVKKAEECMAFVKSKIPF